MTPCNGRVRYSETDVSGRLSMSGLLRLLQDLNYLAVEDAGRGIAYQAAHRAAWYLLSWDVVLTAPPALSAPYRFTSAFYQRVGALARKYMTLESPEGALLAAADTRWGFVDTVTGAPIPCPADYFGAEPLGAPPPQDLSLGGRIRAAAAGEPLPPLTVGGALIDENHHANNVRLTEEAMRLAGADVGCIRLRAEFLRQTRRGARLTPVCTVTDETRYLTLLAEDGRAQARFAFTLAPRDGA